jgi:hypothetical protein
VRELPERIRGVTSPILFILAAIFASFAFSALGILVAAAKKDMPTATIDCAQVADHIHEPSVRTDTCASHVAL